MHFPKTRFFWLALLSAVAAWYWRSVYRFRDPLRLPPSDDFVCPADGSVSFVRRVESGALHGAGVGGLPLGELLAQAPTQQDGWLVGIYVGPLDVHYTYVPADGELEYLEFVPARRGFNKTLLSLAKFGILLGQPQNLLHNKSTLHNERYIYSLKAANHAPISIAAVAPRSGLQATSYLPEISELPTDQTLNKHSLKKGNKALLLEEGGLVLVYLPASLLPQISVGQRVVGGETVLAKALTGVIA